MRWCLLFISLLVFSPAPVRASAIQTPDATFEIAGIIRLARTPDRIVELPQNLTRFIPLNPTDIEPNPGAAISVQSSQDINLNAARPGISKEISLIAPPARLSGGQITLQTPREINLLQTTGSLTILDARGMIVPNQVIPANVPLPASFVFLLSGLLAFFPVCKRQKPVK